MPNKTLSQQDQNSLVKLSPIPKAVVGYPKRAKVESSKDTYGELMDIIKKYWAGWYTKIELGGSGKTRFVRTYHNDRASRDRYVSDMQTTINKGNYEDIEGTEYRMDQNGNIVKSDGTTLGKQVDLENEKQSLFAGVSNTVLIIAAVGIIAVVLFFMRKKK